jgi:hypothetical protein
MDFDDEVATGLELTLMSTLRLTRLALPALRKALRRVVTITSSAVKEPARGVAVQRLLPA